MIQAWQRSPSGFSIALAIDSTNPRARTALGKIREDQGDIPQALADYQVALSRNPRQPHLKARVAALATTVAGPPPVSPTAVPPMAAGPPSAIRY